MNATELATLSISELKSIAIAKGIDVVVGDKRVKATWVDAIVNFQSEQPVIEIATPDPFELPLVEDVTACSHSPMADSIVKGSGYANEIPVPQPTAPTPQPMPQPQQPAPQPTPQQPPTLTPLAIPPTTQYRGALIVILIPLILLTVAVILIKVGISTLIPLIGSLIRFTGSIWQSIPRTNAQAHPLMVVDPNSIPTNYFPA